MSETKKEDAEAEDPHENETNGSPAQAGRRSSLVIVESPAKARTINKYLGSELRREGLDGAHPRPAASGKLRDRHRPGVHSPSTRPSAARARSCRSSSGSPRAAEAVYLAPDMDREGEAIAWHLTSSRSRCPTRPRLPGGVQRDHQEGDPSRPPSRSPGRLDDGQGRRPAGAPRSSTGSWATSSRPLLWKKIAKGLSAGRVQSVAVRLIVEREKEIRAFVRARSTGASPPTSMLDGEAFDAELRRLDGDAHREEPQTRRSGARTSSTRIGDTPISTWSRSRRSPRPAARLPPFTTSAAAAEGLHHAALLSAKKTMMIAQQLYEGVELRRRGIRRSHHVHAYRLDARERPRPSSFGARASSRRTTASRLPAGQGRTSTRRSPRARRKRTRPFVRPTPDAADRTQAREAPDHRPAQALHA